tara:strand:+ start:29 stop:391 length:363 start_codon:yes stop_codon:yes gene_type:complete
VAVLVVKVVEPLIQEDTLVPLVEVAAPAVAILKPQVLETELFQVQQTTMMGTILLCQIRDSLVVLVDLLAVSTMLAVVAVPVEQDMLEIQTHSPMEVLVDQVKRIHLLLLHILHQRFLVQ